MSTVSIRDRFLNLAADFRALDESVVSGSGAVAATLREVEAGRLIAEAAKVGALALPKLAEIVSYHEDPPVKQLGLVTWHRGPIGLFNDIVNGPDPASFKGELAPTPAPFDGLLAHLGYLPKYTPTGTARSALACEKLAGMVVATIEAGPPDAGTPIHAEARPLTPAKRKRGPRVSTNVELDARIRRAIHEDGMTCAQAAREFNITKREAERANDRARQREKRRLSMD